MPPPGTRLQIAAIVSASLSRLPSLLRRSKFYGYQHGFPNAWHRVAILFPFITAFIAVLLNTKDIVFAYVHNIDVYRISNKTELSFFIFSSSNNLIKPEMKTFSRSIYVYIRNGDTSKLNQGVNFSVTVYRYSAATELDYILNDAIKGSICSDLFCGAMPRLVVMLRSR